MLFMMLLFLIISSSSNAGEVEELVRYALENSPVLKTYQNMKRSVQHKERYLKSLPNPSVSAGLVNLPLNRPYPSKYEPMSSFSIGVSQMYTLPIKREREAFVARAEVELLSRQEEVAKRELVRDIKLKYLEWLYAGKKEDLLKNILSEIRLLEKLTGENYKLGKASLSDLFSLSAEAIRVEREIKSLLEEGKLKKLELESLVGKRVELRGEEPNLEEFNLKELNEEKSPYLMAVLGDIERLKAEVERRRVEYLPDFELMAEYMIRPGLDNMFSLRASMSLPLRRSMREDLMVLEKLEELRAKEQELERLKLQLRREINSLKVEEERIRAVQRLTEELMREKERELKALEVSYSFGKAGLRDILRLHRELWELRMGLLELELSLKSLYIRAEVYR